MLTFVAGYFVLMLALLLVARLQRSIHSLFIAMSTLACAVLFFPWSAHRETLSGFCGRMSHTGTPRVASIFMQLSIAIDALFPRERNHCWQTWQEEQALRSNIYDRKGSSL